MSHLPSRAKLGSFRLHDKPVTLIDLGLCSVGWGAVGVMARLRRQHARHTSPSSYCAGAEERPQPQSFPTVLLRLGTKVPFFLPGSSVSNRNMKRYCILLIFAIYSIGARACFCPAVEHACEAYRRVPIIFVGTVVDLGSREANPNTGSYSLQMQFAVDESFKGTSAERVMVTRVHARTSCSSTAPEFAEGGHYLVWAFPDEHGIPVVSDCTAPRRLDDAAQLVSELRSYGPVTAQPTSSATFFATAFFQTV